MDFIKGLKKYVKYLAETRNSFEPSFSTTSISEHAYHTAAQVRGASNRSTIIIHGIMKRSGTVYTGELLGLHPKLCSYPKLVWEIPFLPLTGDILKLEQDFFLAYEQNQGKIAENDFLPIFGAAFIRYLYESVPDGQRMLLKMPGVQYLNYFYTVFPHENLLLLVRDGRDVVTSTIKTWPQLRFSDACRRWDRSAKMIMAFRHHIRGKAGFWFARFEDAVRNPQAFVREACAHFDLDSDIYPFERIEKIPVIGSSTTRKEGRAWMKRPKGFKPVGRWNDWSFWQKRTFKRIAGQSLINLGYCDDLDW